MSTSFPRLLIRPSMILTSGWGQEHRTEKFHSRHDIGSRFEQKENGLEVSVKRAQRLYNNRRWPNAVVLRLENVEFVEQENKKNK